jgi:hypothetical protein
MTYAYFSLVSRAAVHSATRPLISCVCLRGLSLILRDKLRLHLKRKFLPLSSLQLGTSLYWITTFFCSVFTPPLAFCAVMVITLSPAGNGGMK